MQITTQSARPALTACDFYKTRGKKGLKMTQIWERNIHTGEKSEECSKKTSGELFEQYSVERNVDYLEI